MNKIYTQHFGLAIYAQGDQSAKRVALLLPGKLDTKDHAHMRSHVDSISRLGYYSLAFDAPGTWESDGEDALYTTSNYIASVCELVSYLGNRPTVLIGHSRGGLVAATAAVQHDAVIGYAALMSKIGPIDLSKKDDEWRERGYRRSVRADLHDPTKVREYQLPYGHFLDLQHYGLSEVVRMYTKPKLLVAGLQDTTAPVAKVQAAYEVMQDPKHYEILDTAHDYRLYPMMIDKMNQILEQFLNSL